MKARSPRQLSLLPREKQSTQHGGGLHPGKRKLARPFHPKLPMHVVVRASRARGFFSMLHPRHEKMIAALVRKSAKSNQVRLHRFVNVGNHLHLLVQASTREGLQRFLRTLTGRVAALVTGAIKGRPFGKFWDQLAYSRLVHWGRDFKGVLGYFIKNELESVGLADLIPTLPMRARHGPLTL
ncbi:MAG: transposase [Methylotenera sp.]|nr:transposase [Oligoflexia bacterium]